MMAKHVLVSVALITVGFVMSSFRSLHESAHIDTHSKLVHKGNQSTNDEIYRYPIDATIVNSRYYSLPPPLQVMEDYIQSHSVDALGRDPDLSNRKFAIAFYQCPLQAGNRLHHFWNGVLWSILTNRTVLWKYWSEETCLQYGKEFNLEICKAANTADDCGKVLVRAPWMASYDEWEDRISISGEEPFVVPYHAVMGRVWDDEERFPLPVDVEENYGVDLQSKYPQTVLVFPVCHFKYWQLGRTSLQTSLLKTAEARETAAKLYRYGADFLFGMLHRYTFDFATAIRASIPTLGERNNPLSYTVGLHSRHRYAGLDGCNVDREVACLEKILDNRSSKKSPVRVSIMSDRPCTVEQLTLWLQAHNCSAVTAQHNEASPDYIREHGPYAGTGFFQDMALVSMSRSAIIGMKRTSSDLLRELIVFHRVMDAWEAGIDPLTGLEIDSCILSSEAEPRLAR